MKVEVAVHNSPHCLCGRKTSTEVTEFRSCVKVEVAVLGFPSIIALIFSVDIKQHQSYRVQELCESGGGRP